VLGAGCWLFMQLKEELSPDEDRSLFLAFVIAPEGSSMQYTDSYMHAVYVNDTAIPEIDTMFAVVAPGLERPNPVNLALPSPCSPLGERKHSSKSRRSWGQALWRLPYALSSPKVCLRWAAPFSRASNT
jgi:multidrug efflux pump